MVQLINIILFRNYKFVSARIQTEYDSFLYRAVCCLYDNVDKTTWQYLVMLPFGQVSSQMGMHIFQYLLHIKSGILKSVYSIVNLDINYNLLFIIM